MTDMTHLNRRTLPSSQQLLKATSLAIGVAGIILVAAVLPAEYGIDPTGIGSRLGLTSLSASAAGSSDAAAAPAISPSETAPTSVFDAVWKAPVAYRNDETSLTLQANEGVEVKALMKTGDRFFFTWKAEGGNVSFDMHGEKLGAASDEFTSYWKGKAQAEGHGAFQAPFDGIHGWYWRNRGAQPVTITVKTSGFYEKLYRPE